MAYWWVSQNQTYPAERAGEYLWAPTEDSAGQVPHHWATMDDIRPGDIIFSYYRQQIAAVSIAKSRPYLCAKPTDLNPSAPWGAEGKMVDVTYEDSPNPVNVKSVLSDLKPLLPEKYSPISIKGTGNQGYLFRLPPRAGRFLLEAVQATQGEASGDPLALGLERSAQSQTQKLALIQSRVGQGKFRQDLLSMWSSRCCVTGLDIPVLLRASHIKPWRDANNRERLDPYNGLLLCPTYDAASMPTAKRSKAMLVQRIILCLAAAVLWATYDSDIASGQVSELREAYNNYNALYQQGRYSEAESYAKEALRLGTEEFGPNDPTTATFLNNLAALYRAKVKVSFKYEGGD